MLATWLTDKLAEPLVIFGLCGQTVFMLRFVVQWFASERRGRSYVPLAFWYLSCAGGLMLVVYALLVHEPVILFGQSLGLAIYGRNLYLIHRRRYRWRRRLRSTSGPDPAGCPAESLR